MVQGYYGLDEAAKILGMAPDQLSQMAQRREIRAFADRGTWRFRTQDVEEMARRLGKGSNPELQLGEAEEELMAPLPPAAPPKPSPSKPPAEDVFNFSLGSGDQVEIGQEVIIDSPSKVRGSGARGGSGVRPPAPGGARKTMLSPHPGSDSDVRSSLDAPPQDLRLVSPSGVKGDPGATGKPAGRKSSSVSFQPPSGVKGGPPSPPPQPGSDSDVHLVLDQSDAEFRLVRDSDVKLDEPATGKGPPSSKKKLAGAKEPPSSHTGQKKGGSSSQRVDAGVRLVPFDDSAAEGTINMDLPPRSSSDSDIRIELDKTGSSKLRHDPMQPDPHGSSTMEIDLDAELKKAEEAARSKQPRSKVKPKTKAPKDVPSPFELSEEPPTGTAKMAALTPPPPSSTPSSDDFELTPGIPSSSDISLPDEDSVDLGASAPPGSGRSGINLHSPNDSGINLAAKEDSDQTGDRIEFELSMDEASTPPPASSSADDSSDFELTLDEGGELAPLEEETPSSDSGEGEKDIFETDFEMPALEESSSEAVALDDADTDLESSDFELSLSDEESSSQVVPLEEGEESDEGAETVTGQAGVEEEVVEEAPAEEALDEELGGEEELEEEPARAPVAVAQAPANWGVLPALVLFPCVIILFILGLMSFELVRGMWGYKQPYKPTAFMVRGICDLLGFELPKE